MVSLKDLDFAPYVNKAVKDVFSTMLALEVQNANQGLDNLSLEGEKYMGLVGFAGKVSGAVCLTFSKDCANLLAGSMLGLSPDEVEASEVKDVIGEICNMVGGNIKSRLCDMGLDCVLTIPSITTGKNFTYVPLKDPIYWEYGFLTEGFLWLLRLYLKETLK